MWEIVRWKINIFHDILGNAGKNEFEHLFFTWSLWHWLNWPCYDLQGRIEYLFTERMILRSYSSRYFKMSHQDHGKFNSTLINILLELFNEFLFFNIIWLGNGNMNILAENFVQLSQNSVKKTTFRPGKILSLQPSQRI